MIQAMHKISLSTLALLVGFISLAGDDYTKDFSKTYSVSDQFVVELETSFGSVVIENWDKSEVAIFVEITVDASSEKKAEDLFDKIEVIMSGSSSRVSLETDINAGNNDCDFSIDIKIQMPSRGSLEVEHAFGDLNLDVINGKSDIKVSYGNLDANKLSHQDNDIKVEFGDGEINFSGGGDITCEFGSFEIDILAGDADVDCGYGGIEIEHVTSSCKNLDINSEFSEVDITLDENANYSIEAHASFGSVDIGSKANVTSRDSGIGSESIEAKLGSGSGGKIDIQCSFGDVNIDTD
jgi:hypothetical protein